MKAANSHELLFDFFHSYLVLTQKHSDYTRKSERRSEQEQVGTNIKMRFLCSDSSP